MQHSNIHINTAINYKNRNSKTLREFREKKLAVPLCPDTVLHTHSGKDEIHTATCVPGPEEPKLHNLVSELKTLLAFKI